LEGKREGRAKSPVLKEKKRKKDYHPGLGKKGNVKLFSREGGRERLPVSVEKRGRGEEGKKKLLC